MCVRLESHTHTRTSSILCFNSRYKEDGKTYSFNSLFISMRSQQQIRIPLRMAVLNLVHELMHAFGEYFLVPRCYIEYEESYIPMKGNDGRILFECKLCKTSFSSQKAVKQHGRMKHRANHGYPCENTETQERVEILGYARRI